MTQCDANFTKVCLTPTLDVLGEDPLLFRAYIRSTAGACPNGGGGIPCGPVAVAPTSWATMKAMYRN
jgi:hypothetical protein